MNSLLLSRQQIFGKSINHLYPGEDIYSWWRAWGITSPFWWAGFIQTVEKSQGVMAGNRLFWRGWNIRVSLTATVCSITSSFVKAFLILDWKGSGVAILVWKTGWNWRDAIMAWVKFSEASGQNKYLEEFKLIMEPGNWNKRVTTNTEL